MQSGIKEASKMKIAITSLGPDRNSQVDPRFGRAAYILIVDTVHNGVEAIDNSENINAFKGAGIQAAAMVGRKGAEVLLTGYCGPNAYKTLQAAGVKVVSDVSGKVEDAVEALIQGNLAFADSANIEAHW
jgi:predicted Fe-Mo cluster-binding NifX family protein